MASEQITGPVSIWIGTEFLGFGEVEKPMTEAEWLTSTDPQRMLTTCVALETPGACGFVVPGKVGNLAYRASDRKLRLFACAWMRLRPEWDRDAYTRPQRARSVDVAERYADGEATEQELTDARDQIVRWSNGGWVSCWESAIQAAEQAVRNVVGIERQTADALREIVGNPFVVVETIHRPKNAAAKMCWSRKRNPATGERLLTFDEGWLAWNNGTVPRIAKQIYEERAFDQTPILADALEDASCTDETILKHLRQWELCRDNVGWIPKRSPCCRGCWAIDLLLGQE